MASTGASSAQAPQEPAESPIPDTSSNKGNAGTVVSKATKAASTHTASSKGTTSSSAPSLKSVRNNWRKRSRKARHKADSWTRADSAFEIAFEDRSEFRSAYPNATAKDPSSGKRQVYADGTLLSLCKVYEYPGMGLQIWTRDFALFERAQESIGEKENALDEIARWFGEHEKDLVDWTSDDAWKGQQDLPQDMMRHKTKPNSLLEAEGTIKKDDAKQSSSKQPTAESDGAEASKPAAPPSKAEKGKQKEGEQPSSGRQYPVRCIIKHWDDHNRAYQKDYGILAEFYAQLDPSGLHGFPYAFPGGGERRVPLTSINARQKRFFSFGTPAPGEEREFSVFKRNFFRARNREIGKTAKTFSNRREWDLKQMEAHAQDEKEKERAKAIEADYQRRKKKKGAFGLFVKRNEDLQVPERKEPEAVAGWGDRPDPREVERENEAVGRSAMALHNATEKRNKGSAA